VTSLVIALRALEFIASQAPIEIEKKKKNMIKYQGVTKKHQY
jgi:hypothetical protein